MSNEVTSPFTVFFDRSGQPLDNGYVYIGTAGINPEVSPIAVYWDEALTIPAAQPIRTLAGYPSQSGSPGSIFIGQAAYSIVVRDRSGTLVYSNLNAFENIGSVIYLQTYSDLTALTTATGLVDNMVVEVTARTTAGDLGGGTFYYRSDLSSEVVFSTKTVSSVNTGTDVLTATAHGFWTEDVVIASAADAGLSLNTLYYVRWASANTITLHTSVMGARNNTGLVNITALAGSLSLKKLTDPGQGVYVIPTGAALDGSGGGFARDWDGVNASFAWWGATNTIASDQQPAMQAAVYFAGVRNGVVLNLPSGSTGYRIDNKLLISKPNVKIRAPGGYQNHDAGSGVLPATQIFWYGSAGETMVEFKTPYGVSHSKISECELSGIFLDGRRIAGRGFVFDSVGSSLVEDVGILDVTVAGWETTCGVTGTDLPEAADTRDNRFIRVTWRMFDVAAVQSADGYRANGSTNANTCFNYYERCGGPTYNGHGWEWINCDNNVTMLCTGGSVGGSGKGMRFYGEDTGVSGGAYSNTMINPSWGTSGCVRMGAASGFDGPATKNEILHLDTVNGSSIPVDDADVAAAPTGPGRVSTDTGHVYSEGGIRAVFGESVSAILAARTALSATNSVTIYNGSQNHLIITDGTNSWTVRISGSNLDFARTLGSGQFNLPAIAFLLIGGAQLSYGANDSGGVGFKLLRVPN